LHDYYLIETVNLTREKIMKAKEILITREECHELFEYKDGTLYWKESRGSVKTGDEVGTVSGGGYLQVRINKIKVMVHRVIYFMLTGEQPATLDHVDGCRTNNRIENLQMVTQSQNLMKSKKYSSNTSGVTGVYLCSSTGRWQARISISKRLTHLGYYETFEEAVRVRKDAEKKYYGKYISIDSK